MSNEFELSELPELQFTVCLTHDKKGKPVLVLTKKIYEPNKISLLARILLSEQYLPTKLIVKDKLLFYAELKKQKLI